MNLGGGRGKYVFSHEKGFENVGSWMPVTPEKPVSKMRSNLINVDTQEEYLGRGNWQQLFGLPFEQTRTMSSYVTEAANVNSSLQNGSQDLPNSFLGLLSGACDWDNIALADQNQVAISGNGGMSWNENSFASTFEMENAVPSLSLQNTLPNGRTHMSNRPLMLDLNTQDDADWTIYGHNMASISTRNHSYYSNSESSKSYIPQDSIPVPLEPNYNLNSLPRTQANSIVGSNCYLFAPLATDQERMSQNSCLSEIFNNSLVESATHGRDRHDEAVTSIQNGSSERHYDELLQSFVETSLPNAMAIKEANNEKEIPNDTAIKEVNNENENDQGIDLNKTPPQKPAKRRKHRPKVVIEGKPKRKPKPAVPPSANPKEKPAGKRKYVRKNNINVSETNSANVSAEVDQTVGNVPNSCRRLNFDLERSSEASHSNIDEKQTEERQAFNLNSDYQARVTCGESSNVLGSKSVQQNLLSVTNQQAEMACNIGRSTNYIPNGNELPAKRCPPTASANTLKNLRKENINLPSNASNHCSDPSFRRWKDGLNSMQNSCAEGIFSQDRSTPVDIERIGLLMWQRSTQAALKHAADLNEARRLKRGHYLTIGQNHSRNLASKDPPLLHQQIAQIENYTNLGSKLQKDFSEPDKRRKTENEPHSSIASILGRASPNEVDSREFNMNRNHISRQQTTADIYMSNRHHDSSNHSTDTNSTSPIIDAYNFLKKHDLTRSFSCGVAEEDECSNRSTQDFSLVTANILLPPTPQKTDLRAQDDQGTNSCLDNKLNRKQVEAGTESNAVSSCSEAAPLSGDKQPNDICSTDRGTKKKSSQSAAPNVPSAGRGRRKTKKIINQLPSTPVEGMPSRQHTWSDLLDQITSQFKDMGIADQEQNAIVPYKADGTVVAYVAKKRKPRPKVDLDPETERLWKLLMGSDNSEAAKGTDKDKEQWWEEERKIFCGRADSFIARMHLVQGDRRFSQWKGSVVDSVIGVFLTQNVSDHLSSSAFMALASRFPVKTSSHRTCYEDEKGIIVEEPEVSFEEQDNSVKLHDEVLSQQLSDGHSSTVQSPPKAPEPAIQNKSSASHAYTSRNFSEIPKTNRFQVLHSSVAEDPACDENFEEWRCQQEAVESNQTPQRMKKSDGHYGYSGYTSAVNPSNYRGRVQTVLPSNYRLHITPDLRVLEAENLQIFGKGTMPSSPSCDRERINLNSLECTSNRFGQNPPDSDDMVVGLNELSRQQHSSISKVTSNMLLQHIESSLAEGFNKDATEYSNKYNSNQETKIFLNERTSVTNSSTLGKAQVGHRGSNMLHISSALEPRGTLVVEGRASVGCEQILMKNNAQTFEGNGHHSTMCSETNTAKSKPRKVKVSDEKKNAFDWDSLRRQAQSKFTRGKTRDTMDSMDYEAIRNATVNEISNTIRERGMNNMLADRIKDFLDRTVREHGSIDLEWLRDAPPDKVKEFLLSIRGLGLKSVECVRLLTLHHLAFPVDTNVGRIAVRLGWVPLQPLPESLQLHLLEMYPMLESIQKYLWPRLCKLDQRTLYELHYQMITFGKVFCTKSKPNCNACPMRGECRHFASAFASARLALPGPEEKRIVTSNVPTTAEMDTAVGRDPMMLPQLENTRVEERSNAICEPIIEEPASPEPEGIGITETDIEDAFWEDPDEIPTIKLNIKNFTQNLQNYMQENNYEVQGGDMSKALVALDPAAASIPTQKLKNVSRLRTEHQVYELPDSHPLLKGFEGREPDDPSPYLLAIWTPGETANSTGAPESQCGSQDSGKLCNNMTCFSCNSTREVNSNTVRGTILIPCRTAMRGSFPLNGTYFQVNEMFADHDSSIDPLNIPRQWIWNLPRRTVFFGTSVSSIFKGLSTEQIQFCFWRGFVCVRGFDKKSRAPKPLMARLHFPASKIVKAKDKKK